MLPGTGVRGSSAVFVLRHPWRPRCSGARKQPRPCFLSGTDGIGPADCGERIERCSQVRRSAPTRVHVQESVRGPTTATLAGQGLRTLVPRHTAFTCLRESWTGW